VTAHERLFDQFRQASTFARDLARTNGHSVSVSRRGTRWGVSLTSFASRFSTESPEEPESGFFDDDDSDAVELTSEFMSTQDDAERSNEEGWYYED
jgi:hypothetical protein